MHTIESIQCYPIDTAKITEEINKRPDKPTNVTYSIYSKFALVKSPRLAIIDDEFVGKDLTDKVSFSIYESIVNPDGTKTHDCLPSHTVTFKLSELEPYLNPPVSLAEFTKERRGYNSRIRSNEMEWLRIFNTNSQTIKAS